MYWDSNCRERLHYLSEFTKIYRSFDEDKISEREVAVLCHQVPEIFLDPLPGDVITGRMKYPPLIFTPQGAAEHGGYAYVFDQDKFEELFADPEFSEKEREKLLEIKDYWQKEDTARKTRSEYPEILQYWLPSDNWTGEPGVAFPLYRMSGSQMDMEKLVRLGIPGLRKEIEKKLASTSSASSKSLYTSMVTALELFSGLCDDYVERIEILLSGEKQGNSSLKELKQAILNIRDYAPENFLEAVQLIHFYVLISGSNNYGRLDVALAPVYQKDKERGKTDEYFLSVLESFWKLINFRGITWDGRIIIGGKDRLNLKSEDELAILMMEATRRVKDILPQLTLRCYENMNPELLEKAYQLFGEGNTYPMLYNDEVNIPAAGKAFDVDLHTASDCIPFGCGEYVLYHRSYGTPSGVINLLKILEISMRNGLDRMGGGNMGVAEANEMNILDFEDLYMAFLINLEHYCFILAFQEKYEYEFAGKTASFLFLSMLFDDCIESGKAIFSGGVSHLGGTLETYGNTNTGDSLYVIKEIVFREKKMTLEEMVEILDTNFEGNEQLRLNWKDMPKYGNNIEEVDELMKRVHVDVCNITKMQAEKVGLDSYLVVNINNSANSTLGKYTAASSDGRKKGMPMANGNTPTMGCDKDGVTSLFNSLVKMPVDIHAGASQNIKFSKEMFGGKLPQTRALIKSYFKLGGAQLMITCVGREELENAMKEPEKYSNLLVRVGGFSARFVELDYEVQMEILQRTLY